MFPFSLSLSPDISTATSFFGWGKGEREGFDPFVEKTANDFAPTGGGALFFPPGSSARCVEARGREGGSFFHL